MNGLATRLLPYSLAFFSSLCIMILELVASRLVARHVGLSLDVWNCVIGVMLGGICLGNVLGGRLADRVDPRRAVGPLYAFGAALTLGCLWLNSIGGLIPDMPTLPWIRTLLVVTIDFLIPGTLLGMIGPVVAKLAVEQSQKAGSAIGDVYTMGAVGSIVGTFFAGFVLLMYAPISVVVTLVGLALVTFSGLLIGDKTSRILGLTAGALLGLGSIAPLTRAIGLPTLQVGGVPLNVFMLAGHAATVALAVVGIARLREASRNSIASEPADELAFEAPGQSTSLRDLAVLSFIASMAFMAFEMAASRFVTHHLGSSIYGWTSVLGVLLAGLSVGNFIGGKVADRITKETQASWLFVAASFFVLTILIFEISPRWLVWNPIEYLNGKEPKSIFPGGSALSQAIVMKGYPWWSRVLIVVSLVFFLPAVSLGTVSPVVAKLAVDRLRASKRTGRAIGQVYAWGMVGSILGTFITGFFLIDIIGTKGVILLIAVSLGLAAAVLGSISHAVWAGVPLGLCVIAFVPIPALERQGVNFGIREERGDPNTNLTTGDGNPPAPPAWIDESNYYFIKVSNKVISEDLDNDANKRTIVLDNLEHGYFTIDHPEKVDYPYEYIYALVSHRIAQSRAKDVKKQKLDDLDLKTLFFGGGAYTFPRYLQLKYPGTKADVAEIDPAILKANQMALGLGRLPSDKDIETTIGDARAFVERNKAKRYDLIYGDAFNDFSVPWHLTTKEFNDKVAGMLAPGGAYMINIIDVYESDAKVEELVDRQFKKLTNGTDADRARLLKAERAKADQYTGFLGAWVETARKSFKNVWIFGTDDPPGSGLRETFVVVVSNSDIDIDKLGERDDDPKFTLSDRIFQPKPYAPADVKAVAERSRGIILTDDYAPVENLLGPVAATRGSDDD